MKGLEFHYISYVYFWNLLSSVKSWLNLIDDDALEIDQSSETIKKVYFYIINLMSNQNFSIFGLTKMWLTESMW